MTAPTKAELARLVELREERRAIDSKSWNLKTEEDKLVEKVRSWMDSSGKKACTRLGFVLSLDESNRKYPKWKDAILERLGQEVVNEVEAATLPPIHLSVKKS